MSLVILDSDFWFSYCIPEQSTHDKAVKTFQSLDFDDLKILNITKQELATVLSRKVSQEVAILIIKEVSELIEEVFLTREDELQVWKLFYSYTFKNISFIDCANLYFATKHFGKIASFDSFYPTNILLS